MIRPRPAVRAFGLAAALTLGGAALAVAAAVSAWPAPVQWLGFALIGAGLGLVVVAVWAARRARVTVELDAAGYRVVEPGGVRTGTWAEVSKVTAAPGRLTLHAGPERRVHLIGPPGPQLDAIAGEIARRLDADRGLRHLEG